jgi:hypothetical protein
MVRFFRHHYPEREKCISYQDLAVHTGTIYKAAGWSVEYIGKPRIRDRGLSYHGGKRWSRVGINGTAPDQAGKARWAISLLVDRVLPNAEAQTVTPVTTDDGSGLESSEKDKARLSTASASERR